MDQNLHYLSDLLMNHCRKDYFKFLLALNQAKGQIDYSIQACKPKI